MDELVSKGYAAERRGLIDPASASVDVGRGSPVSGSDTDETQLLAQSLSVDWLVLPALQLRAAGTRTRTYPEGETDQTVLAQGVYYVNRYMDVQVGYTFNKFNNLVDSTTHSFNLFLNGRF